jgi:hypothetical protein
MLPRRTRTFAYKAPQRPATDRCSLGGTSASKGTVGSVGDASAHPSRYDSVVVERAGALNATSVRQLFGRRPTAVAAVVAIEEVARVLRKAVDAFRARQPGC